MDSRLSCSRPGSPGCWHFALTCKLVLPANFRELPDLADFLTGFLNRPVTDATGLTAKYGFVVNFAADSMAAKGPDGTVAYQTDAQPGFFAALQVPDSACGLTKRDRLR